MNIKNRLRRSFESIIIFKDWYKTIYPLNRYFSGPQTLHVRNGMVVPVSSIFSQELALLTSYVYYDEYKLGAVILPSRPIIIDLGANIGLFSIDAKNHFPDATIVAYEPHPTTFEILKRNAPFAQVIQHAAAGEDGLVRIQSGGKSTHRTLVEEDGIEVQADSLNTILSGVQRVDLLKVDIEGSEFALFENASNSTLQKIQNILLEVHGNVIGEFSFNSKIYEKRESRNHWVEEFFVPKGFKVCWLEDWGVVRLERH